MYHQTGLVFTISGYLCIMFISCNVKNHVMLFYFEVQIHCCRCCIIQCALIINQHLAYCLCFFQISIKVKEEFGRIMGKPNPVKCMANTFKEVWVQKILKYGLTQTVGNSIMASIDEACQDNPNKKSGNI